uniref:NADH-ubiquinone oxidoreductase chain 4 n=1 Tax=Uzeldikra longiprocessa TaxID=2893152 RepID=A0A9E7BY36_9HEMI|nr:NADH dehydrogenase subunit 4 [Uzeldikra longiprocessa]UGN61298.1 NADH dehydrogenase subunit 4 [Uzeldikra longiprocessa]
MKYILYLFFLIPLSSFHSWFMIQSCLIFLILLFIMSNINHFFSCISYFMSMDYLSYGLIILTFLIISLMIMSTVNFNNFIYSYFIMLNLILCLILFMIFSSMNMLIMYIMFEFSLIPLMILIFGWGYQPERLMSGLYLFFYTLFASLPLLIILVYFLLKFKVLFFDLNFNNSFSFIIHCSMMLAFLVKMPMYMVHFWLPKAHVQAPVSGSMILAGLLLKIGGYGIIRFMFIYEYLFLNYSFIWFSMSILGSILVSLICFIQGDLKCMIAYSSVAHMGMCIMSMMTMTYWGVFGSYLMMISHGLCSSALFCLANISYSRYLSRSFFLNKGLLLSMPSLSLLWFLFCSFNMSCPPSLNFISEIFIISSMITYWDISFIYFFFISFFSACFSFYLFSFSQHGINSYLYNCSYGFVREYLLLFIHLLPIFFILLNMNFFFY